MGTLLHPGRRALLRMTLAAAPAIGAFVVGAAPLDAQPVRLPVRRDSGVSVRPIAAIVRMDGDTTLRPAPRTDTLPPTSDTLAGPLSLPRAFRSRADSIASVRTRLAAEQNTALRVVISLNDRQLWAVLGTDTLLAAPVAVSTDETLEYAGRKWTFETPRGVRTVLAKKEDPVWTPPDWHYAEMARERSLKLADLPADRPVMLSDGTRLTMQGGVAGIYRPSSYIFEPLPLDEHIIFDNTLFIPPVGSKNRRIEGELGRHMLDTGDGYLLHGTPHQSSIGTAATHGCIRLRDEDIAWLFSMIPVGTKVYIY